MPAAGPVRGFWDGLCRNLFSPREFFSPVNLDRVRRPSFFLMAVVFPAAAVSGCWRAGMEFFGSRWRGMIPPAVDVWRVLLWNPGAAAVAALALALAAAAVVHLGLLVTRSAGGRGAGTAYRVFSRSAAAAAFAVVPVVGRALALWWAVGLVVLGLHQAYGVGFRRLSLSMAAGVFALAAILIVPAVILVLVMGLAAGFLARGFLV